MRKECCCYSIISRYLKIKMDKGLWSILLKESTRKSIFLFVVAFIVVGIITAKVMAKSQDEQFYYEDYLYSQAYELYANQNFLEAEPTINELLSLKPNSESVNYLAAMIEANNANYGKSAILFQKTMDINAYKSEDPSFMIQFGEVLFYAERYADAKVVLERCRDMGWTLEAVPNYQERISELLTQIENIQ